MKFVRYILLALLIFAVACGNDTPEDEVPDQSNAIPTTAPQTDELVDAAQTADDAEPTVTPLTRASSPDEIEFITVAIDVPDRTGNFERFDAFGNIEGVDADMMALIANSADIDYEFLVTPFNGAQEGSGILESVATGVFDAAISAIDIDNNAYPGIVFTAPYLEVGQVLVARANEFDLTSYRDVTADMKVAVVDNTISEQAARQILQVGDDQIIELTTETEAMQAVSDFVADVAIVDSFDAKTYTDRYYQRLKMVGVESADFWLTQQRYAIAVAEDNGALLTLLNNAIAAVNESAEPLTVADRWLVPNDSLTDADESLIGTPPDRVLVGVVGELGVLNPAERGFDLLDWEVKTNIMSGLMRYDADNNLIPALAAQPPTVSNGGLVYDFVLRDGLVFPDGTPLNAEAVKQSITRSALSGNWFINAYLKNSDADGFADDDSIVVVGENEVRFVLREPIGFFTSLLATPPYFIVSPNCDPNAFDPQTNCGGIGPFQVESWERGAALRLQANTGWPLATPSIDKVELRFYANSAELSTALANESIDIAWHGLLDGDIQTLSAAPSLNYVQGPGIFKSYIVFEHTQEPWDNPAVRQAAALAVDRDAIAQDVFDGRRLPLYGPLPKDIPTAENALPERDVEAAVALLNSAGYSTANPLPIDLWYIDDGRYTLLEDEYATAIKDQLEETGIFQVTLQGAPWITYRAAMSTCEYPAFLLGWPPSSEPRYLEAMTWLNYFITNTESICSNYTSETMDALLVSTLGETDPIARANNYREMQALWADDLPTLDLTQDTLDAVARQSITNININALGILHYETLSK